MGQHAYGTSRTSGYTNNIDVIKVAVCHDPLSYCNDDANLSPDCCLDVEWINENTFASAGADTRIFIMRIDEDEPVKTLK